MGVAVGQERIAAETADLISHRTGEIRTEKRKVSRFAEVDFDRDKFAVQPQFIHLSFLQKIGQFLQDIFAKRFYSEIGKVYFCFFHDRLLFAFRIKYTLYSRITNKYMLNVFKLFAVMQRSDLVLFFEEFSQTALIGDAAAFCDNTGGKFGCPQHAGGILQTQAGQVIEKRKTRFFLEKVLKTR